MNKQDVLFNYDKMKLSYPEMVLKTVESRGHHLQVALWGPRLETHRVYSVSHPRREKSCIFKKNVVTTNPASQAIVEVIEKGKRESRGGWIRYTAGKEEVYFPPRRSYVVHGEKHSVITSTVWRAFRKREKV